MQRGRIIAHKQNHPHDSPKTHIYFRSDAISVMGAPAVVMPLVAILIGVGMIVLTKSAIAKGWLR